MAAGTTLLGLLAVPLLVAGCASGEATTPAAATTQAPAEPPIASPPAEAQTPCSDAVRGQVQAALGLASVPAPESAWEDNRQTCTYRTPDGPLVFAVTVASTDAVAADHLTALRDELGASSPLTRLADAYQNGLGAVVARDGNRVLVVDAGELPPEHLGPEHQTRTGLAINLATGVVDGWAGRE